MITTFRPTEARLYLNDKANKLLAFQVRQATGAKLVINAALFDKDTWKALCDVKAEGKVISDDSYTYRGIGWNTGSGELHVTTDINAYENYISCVMLINNGAKLSLIQPGGSKVYTPDVGRSAGRTAVIGFDDGSYGAWCVKDGEHDMTPEELQGAIFALGRVVWCLMLDGGGSSQLSQDGDEYVYSSRPTQSYLCFFWNEAAGTTALDGVTARFITKNRCYTNQVKCSKTKAMLHSTGTPGAKAAAFIANMNSAAADTSVEFVIDDTGTYQLLPLGIKSWHCGASANNTHVACEICEPLETRVLPVNWKTLGLNQAGNTEYAVTLLQKELLARGYDPKGIDGDFGKNTEAALIACQKSLGLTADGLCGVKTLAKLADRDGSYLAYPVETVQPYFEAVYARAVALFAQLMTELGGKPEEIVCHSEGYALGIASNHADVMHWFPRHGKTMDDFRADVAAEVNGKTEQPSALEQAVDKLAAAGVIDSPDYWKAGNYSAATVEKVLVKMAAAL